MTQRERGTREGHGAPGHDGAVDAGVMTDWGKWACKARDGQMEVGFQMEDGFPFSPSPFVRWCELCPLLNEAFCPPQALLLLSSAGGWLVALHLLFLIFPLSTFFSLQHCSSRKSPDIDEFSSYDLCGFGIYPPDALFWNLWNGESGWNISVFNLRRLDNRPPSRWGLFLSTIW